MRSETFHASLKNVKKYEVPLILYHLSPFFKYSLRRWWWQILGCLPLCSMLGSNRTWCLLSLKMKCFRGSWQRYVLILFIFLVEKSRFTFIYLHSFYSWSVKIFSGGDMPMFCRQRSVKYKLIGIECVCVSLDFFTGRLVALHLISLHLCDRFLRCLAFSTMYRRPFLDFR